MAAKAPGASGITDERARRLIAALDQNSSPEERDQITRMALALTDRLCADLQGEGQLRTLADALSESVSQVDPTRSQKLRESWDQFKRRATEIHNDTPNASKGTNLEKYELDEALEHTFRKNPVFPPAEVSPSTTHAQPKDSHICSLPDCTNMGKLEKCTRCWEAAYCCQKHQEADRLRHRSICVLRK